MQTVYLDNNATTRPDAAVADLMTRVLREEFGNPSSVHRLGQSSRAAIDHARAQVAQLVACRDREITFTGSGTEASNTVLRGIAKKRPGRIVTSLAEHEATHRVCERLEAEGHEIVWLPVDHAGRVEPSALETSLAEGETSVVSLIWANNETGVLNDVAACAAVCQAAKVPLHLDATQVVGKLPVDLPAVGCDAATFSPHKFHGLKGVGCLYARRGFRVPPLIVGGPQERDRRGGTENVLGIVAAGVAAEQAEGRMAEMPRVRQLRDAMERRLLDSIDELRVTGATADRLPNTSNLAFKGLQAEAILMMLSEAGICASAGAACSSGSLEPSRVLLAMGVEEPWAFGSIRLSLSTETTEDDVDRVVVELPQIVQRLRRVMPVG